MTTREEADAIEQVERAKAHLSEVRERQRPPSNLPNCPNCGVNDDVKRLAVLDRYSTGEQRTTQLVGVFFCYCRGSDQTSIFTAKDPDA